MKRAGHIVMNPGKLEQQQQQQQQQRSAGGDFARVQDVGR